VRKISTREITKATAVLCIKANLHLRSDVYQALKKAFGSEKNKRAKRILKSLIENADYAKDLNLAICQDTGLPYVFVKLGQDVKISGGDLVRAINRGIEIGYKKGCLRNSVISHPLKRASGCGFSPAVVHIDIVRGRGLELAVLPKGFGSENKSQVRMFRPTESIESVCKFIASVAREAGASACPPFVIAVGIGGGMDQAALLAKKALLHPLNKRNKDLLLARLERDLLKRINRLNIGPMGLGGKTTCLGVNIQTHSTHIAGLPVAVNISCHALRSARKKL